MILMVIFLNIFSDRKIENKIMSASYSEVAWTSKLMFRSFVELEKGTTIFATYKIGNFTKFFE